MLLLNRQDVLDGELNAGHLAPLMIELDTQTVAVLEAWKTKQDAERELVGAGYDDHGLIFCRPDGRPYHPEAFSKTSTGDSGSRSSPRCRQFVHFCVGRP